MRQPKARALPTIQSLHVAPAEFTIISRRCANKITKLIIFELTFSWHHRGIEYGCKSAQILRIKTRSLCDWFAMLVANWRHATTTTEPNTTTRFIITEHYVFFIIIMRHFSVIDRCWKNMDAFFLFFCSSVASLWFFMDSRKTSTFVDFTLMWMFPLGFERSKKNNRKTKKIGRFWFSQNNQTKELCKFTIMRHRRFDLDLFFSPLLFCVFLYRHLTE